MLERLLVLEAELKNGLLRDNYYGLTETNGVRCSELVKEYVELSESLIGKDPVFIKGITKIASLGFDYSNCAEDILMKLYQFNREGVEETRIKKNLSKRISSILMSHFFSHAGNIAGILSYITEKFFWYQKTYECYFRSGALSEEFDIEHSAHSYLFAGDTASKIAGITRNRKWDKRAVKCYKKSLKCFESFANPKFCRIKAVVSDKLRSQKRFV